MSTAAATRRIPTKIAGLYFVEWLVFANVLIAHTWIFFRGADLGGIHAILGSLQVFGKGLGLQFCAGVAIRSIWALIRRERGYFRKIMCGTWIVLTVRMILAGVLTIHAYGWLKLMVPILNPVRYDQQLWAIDRALFLDRSPNVLFLELFTNEHFIRFVDVSYGLAFIGTVLVASMAILSATSDRIRVAYVTGNSFLWILGAYLYVLVPSLGPAYAFPEIWTDVSTLFRESQHWQYELFKNYQLVLEIPLGRVDPRINLFYGVAAFPSMHVAFQVYIALWMGLLSPRVAILFRFLVGVIFLGSVLTGWHYLIDGVAGIALALSCFIVTKKVFHLDRWDRMRTRAAAAVLTSESTPAHH